MLQEVGMLFKTHGVHADAVIGHSAGEAAAAYASGAFTLEEPTRPVYDSSMLQNRTAGCGCMLVVRLDRATGEETGESTDGGVLGIACENSPGNRAVCGAAAAECFKVGVAQEQQGAIGEQVGNDEPFGATPGDVSGSMTGCISFNLSSSLSACSSGISPLDTALKSLGVKACDPAFGADNYLGQEARGAPLHAPPTQRAPDRAAPTTRSLRPTRTHPSRTRPPTRPPPPPPPQSASTISRASFPFATSTPRSNSTRGA